MFNSGRLRKNEEENDKIKTAGCPGRGSLALRRLNRTLGGGPRNVGVRRTRGSEEGSLWSA